MNGTVEPIRREYGPASHTHKHEAILNFIVANPMATLRQISAHFGYSMGWLSLMINSRAFQARLAQRQDEVFDGVVLMELKDKITGAAHLAIDRLAEKLEESEDICDIKDSAELLLNAAGYGRKAMAPAQTNNVIFINPPKEALAHARELLRAAQPLPQLEIEDAQLVPSE